MSVGREYYPPRVNVSVFNPANFVNLGEANSTITNQQTIDTLKAQTDTITTNATAQNTKFKAIIDCPFTSGNFNESFTLTGTFNTSQTYEIPYILTDKYYYFVSIYLNYTQSGTPVAIQSIYVYNSWTSTNAGWNAPDAFNTESANPSLQMSFAGVGINTKPLLTFTYGYTGTPNTNSFTASGKFTIIGIQTVK